MGVTLEEALEYLITTFPPSYQEIQGYKARGSKSMHGGTVGNGITSIEPIE